jgi:hypothetical protein
VQCWWFEEEKVEIEKRNLKDIYWSAHVWENIKPKHPTRSCGNLFGEEEKQIENKATEQTWKKIGKF